MNTSELNSAPLIHPLKLALGALLVAFLMLLAPGRSGAATYSVWSCTGPDGAPIANNAWLAALVGPGTPDFTVNGNCSGLNVHAGSSALEATTGGEHRFSAPSDVTIVGYRLSRSVNIGFNVGPTTPTVSAGVREFDGTVTTDRDCDAVDSGCAISSSTVERSGLSLERISVGVWCVDAAGCAAGRIADATANMIPQRVDLEDSDVPVISQISGTLPGSNLPAAASRGVSVDASDIGSGVARVELRIDGGPPRTASTGGQCTQPYTVPKPCPNSYTAPFGVDTQEFSDGAHIASVQVLDAAGNSSPVQNFFFAVSSGGNNPVPPVPSIQPNNGSPAVEQPLLAVDLDRVTANAKTRRIVAGGRLTTQAGGPIAGAALEVTLLDLGVAEGVERSLGTIVTGGDGRFSLALTPSGAQRISFAFRPEARLRQTAVATTVVRQKLGLSIKRSKARVRIKRKFALSGKLSGAGAAAGGAPVEIQNKIGGKWRAVAVVTTRANGSWKWNYRFQRVRRATRFSFRAVVRSNKGWPWAMQKSKQAKVLVSR